MSKIEDYRAIAVELITSGTCPIWPKESFGQAHERVYQALKAASGRLPKEYLEAKLPRKKKATLQVLGLYIGEEPPVFSKDKAYLRSLGDKALVEGRSNTYFISKEVGL